MRRLRLFAATLLISGAIAAVQHPAVSWANPCASVGGRHVTVGGCADPGSRLDNLPPPQDDDTTPTPSPAPDS